MADVAGCIDKLVATRAISRAIGDEALDMFRRSREQYSRSMGPASADAAAALEAAKMLQERAATAQAKIAAGVATWHKIEQRVIDDPRGGMLQINALNSKDTLLGDPRLNALRRENPEHPIFKGGNVDSNAKVLRRSFYNMLGPEIEKFKGKTGAANAPDLIHELLTVDTGNQAAKAVAAGWEQMNKTGVARARAAGIDLDPTEHYFPQPWTSRRVAKFSESEFTKDFQAEIDAGGIKVRDKGEPPTGPTLFAPAHSGFYADAGKIPGILKKAYEDIKYEGGETSPFSRYMRTFEFQPTEAGANAWLRLQAKYGTGNEIMSVFDQHIDHMASDIALHEIWGPNPRAAFEAAMRLAKVKNPKEALAPGLRIFDSEQTARNTFNEVSGGRGFSVGNVGNEVIARRMSGIRQVLGAAALRNLPVSIVPSDSAMVFLSAHHDGMSGLDVISHTLSGGMTRQEAAHLQIAAHSHIDFVQNSARRYPDEINWSGLARAVPNFVVKATLADRWTRNVRLGYQMSYFHQLADMADRPWQGLDPRVRENLLGQYGFTPAEWDKIRAIPPDVAPNGAKYVNLPELAKAEPELNERLQRMVAERSSYGAHQPDARTRAIAKGGAMPGTLPGELQLGAAQYKQFALERMSTHLMRSLYEGTGTDRIKYGIAFTLLSMGAGAISLQAANVLAGKNPADMSDPMFWVRSFAKGGAGGVYGDLLAEGLQGNVAAGAGFLGGPQAGLLTDIGKIPFNLAKRELFDEEGNRATAGPINDTFRTLERWTPNTWYTKLAMDRLFWEQLQNLLDPNFSDNMERAAQRATQKRGTGYWFAPGAAVPQ